MIQYITNLTHWVMARKMLFSRLSFLFYNGKCNLTASEMIIPVISEHKTLEAYICYTSSNIKSYFPDKSIHQL